jgi:hypothetical protein
MAEKAVEGQSAPIASLPRLLAVAATVALFGVGMSVFLDYYKFKSAVQAATRSRMLVAAGAVGDALQQALALGVPLAAVAGAPDLLARERLTDPAIADIRVFDATGQVLYATHGTGDQALEGSGHGMVELPIRNSFDVAVGRVAVRYSIAGDEAALRAMRRELGWIALWGYTDMVVLACLGLALALRTRRHAPAPDQR